MIKFKIIYRTAHVALSSQEGNSNFTALFITLLHIDIHIIVIFISINEGHITIISRQALKSVTLPVELEAQDHRLLSPHIFLSRTTNPGRKSFSSSPKASQVWRINRARATPIPGATMRFCMLSHSLSKFVSSSLRVVMISPLVANTDRVYWYSRGERVTFLLYAELAEAGSTLFFVRPYPLAPEGGFEPPTCALTVRCSAIELLWNRL